MSLKFGLVWINGNKVTGGGGENVLNRPGDVGLEFQPRFDLEHL